MKSENYNDLYVFMLVAREGSFTKAAEYLGVAQSGVSRTVSALEQRLGLSLLTRSTRKLALTQAGRNLYQDVQESFRLLNNSLEKLGDFRDTPSGTVRINASQHAIDRILLPKLDDFGQYYPDIRLEFISETRFVDIVADGYDAGVRVGGEVAEDMVAVQINQPIEMGIVATPDYLQKYGFPKTLADLSLHSCIGYRFADGSIYAWEMGHYLKHIPQGQWVFNDSYMEVAAVRRGLGLAYVPLDLVADDLKAGELIRVLPQYGALLPPSYLYYPHRNVPAALKTVVEALRER